MPTTSCVPSATGITKKLWQKYEINRFQIRQQGQTAKLLSLLNKRTNADRSVKAKPTVSQNSRTTTPVTAIRVFLVYVRPILEYCSVVWSPCTKKDIDCIEKVQRQFTKRLPGLKSMSYTDRLKCLDLTTLELRRLHLDLIFCYKIVFGMVAIKFSDIFEFSHVSKTRGHAYTNCLNSIATTVLATGFLPKELLVCGMPCQQV